MPTRKPTPGELPAELVLAAIDRAYRHRRNYNNPGVPLVEVKEHLGLPRTGSATLRLRPTWQALHTAGLIEQARQSDRVVWKLTPTGTQQLEAARKTGTIGPLPEAPQHQHWREAHTAASERIGELQEQLRTALAEATDLLGADPQADSNAWYETGKQLKTACLRLGSATHCLHEWPEPDDASADTDKPPHDQRGRREYWTWAEC